ncbi:uncharacterized protein VP01_8607g1, partial [Puccinia sorghi]
GLETTSQIESSHSYNLLGPQYKFITVIKLITKALVEDQNQELSAQLHHQKINNLKNLSSAFNICLGKATHFSLRKAQNNYKLQKFSHHTDWNILQAQNLNLFLGKETCGTWRFTCTMAPEGI